MQIWSFAVLVCVPVYQYIILVLLILTLGYCANMKFCCPGLCTVYQYIILVLLILTLGYCANMTFCCPGLCTVYQYIILVLLILTLGYCANMKFCCPGLCSSISIHNTSTFNTYIRVLRKYDILLPWLISQNIRWQWVTYNANIQLL